MLFKQTQTEFSWKQEWECELHSGVERVDAPTRGMHGGTMALKTNSKTFLPVWQDTAYKVVSGQYETEIWF